MAEQPTNVDSILSTAVAIRSPKRPSMASPCGTRRCHSDELLTHRPVRTCSENHRTLRFREGEAPAEPLSSCAVAARPELRPPTMCISRHALSVSVQKQSLFS